KTTPKHSSSARTKDLSKSPKRTILSDDNEDDGDDSDNGLPGGKHRSAADVVTITSQSQSCSSDSEIPPPQPPDDDDDDDIEIIQTVSKDGYTNIDDVPYPHDSPEIPLDQSSEEKSDGKEPPDTPEEPSKTIMSSTSSSSSSSLPSTTSSCSSLSCSLVGDDPCPFETKTKNPFDSIGKTDRLPVVTRLTSTSTSSSSSSSSSPPTSPPSSDDSSSELTAESYRRLEAKLTELAERMAMNDFTPAYRFTPLSYRDLQRNLYATGPRRCHRFMSLQNDMTRDDATRMAIRNYFNAHRFQAHLLYLDEKSDVINQKSIHPDQHREPNPDPFPPARTPTPAQQWVFTPHRCQPSPVTPPSTPVVGLSPSMYTQSPVAPSQSSQIEYVTPVEYLSEPPPSGVLRVPVYSPEAYAPPKLSSTTTPSSHNISQSSSEPPPMTKPGYPRILRSPDFCRICEEVEKRAQAQQRFLGERPPANASVQPEQLPSTVPLIPSPHTPVDQLIPNAFPHRSPTHYPQPITPEVNPPPGTQQPTDSLILTQSTRMPETPSTYYQEIKNPYYYDLDIW
ncbi:MAG: hypothetical protein J5614_02670, partial [Paludibacteraceae bacterium]|nr:hypothetical protein [Paludibacteraceae bacterium]